MASNSLCDPCQAQDKHAEGKSWCPVCEETLCSDCTSHHNFSKASKTHQLVDIGIASAIPSDFSTQQFCDVHNELQIEYFCRDNDAICCRAYLAESHRSCEKVIALDMACKNAKKSLLDDARNETTNIVDTLKALDKQIKTNNSELDNDGSKIEEEIAQMKKKIFDRVNEIEKSLVTELYKTKDKNKTKLHENSKKVQSIKENATTQLKQIDFVNEHGTDKQAFILAHKLKTFLRDTERSVSTIALNTKIVRLFFSGNNEMISSLTNLGRVAESEMPTDVKYVPKNQQQAQFVFKRDNPVKSFEVAYSFELKMSDRPNTVGMIATVDGKLLLCNLTEACGVLVYSQDGQYIQTITMTGQPFDIAYIPDGRQYVVVLPYEKSIQFISSDMKPGKNIKLPFGNNSYGIAATNRNIYVGDESKILVLNIDGNIQKQINNGCCAYMYVLKTEKLYTTRWNVLHLVDQNGKEETSFSVRDTSFIRTVVVDHHGYVYAGSQDTGKIHRLTADLKPDMIIENDSIRRLGAICFNHNWSQLFVTNEFGKSVVVFSCK